MTLVRTTALASIVGAAVAPCAGAITVEQPQEITIAKTAGVTEVPPDVVPSVDGHLSLYLTHNSAYRCETRLSVFADPDCTKAELVTTPALQVYRRSYYGAFSAENVRSASGRTWRLTANHGENKNTAAGEVKYEARGDEKQNTVLPAIRTQDCYSGVQPGGSVYEDCWDAYFGFIGVSRTPGRSGYSQNLGPAIWPANGYANSTHALSHGVQHPSLVHGGDGYVYMAYYDTGVYGPGVVAKNAGFRIARSRGSDLGRRWRTWVAKRKQWMPSLPAPRRLGARSPSHESTPLFESGSSVLTLARTTDGRFISVEQGTDDARPCGSSFRSRTRIRFSRNARDWGKPIELRGPDFDGCNFYATSRLTYPRFLSADGRSTKLINPRRFFLMGTQYGGRVWTARVSMAGPG